MDQVPIQGEIGTISDRSLALQYTGEAEIIPFPG
jgi:hypothetical protein